MTPEETRQQAHSEGLTLLVSEANKTGYFGVNLSWVGQPKPYKAQVKRGGKSAHLGEAALLPPRFSAASSAVAKQPRLTCWPTRLTRAW